MREKEGGRERRRERKGESEKEGERERDVKYVQNCCFYFKRNDGCLGTF